MFLPSLLWSVHNNSRPKICLLKSNEIYELFWSDFLNLRPDACKQCLESSNVFLPWWRAVLGVCEERAAMHGVFSPLLDVMGKRAKWDVLWLGVNLYNSFIQPTRENLSTSNITKENHNVGCIVIVFFFVDASDVGCILGSIVLLWSLSMVLPVRAPAVWQVWQLPYQYSGGCYMAIIL